MKFTSKLGKPDIEALAGHVVWCLVNIEIKSKLNYEPTFRIVFMNEIKIED